MNDKILFEGITQESRMIRFRRILVGAPDFVQFENKINQFFTSHGAAYDYLISKLKVQGMFHILRRKGLNDLKALLHVISFAQETKMNMQMFVNALGQGRK